MPLKKIPDWIKIKNFNRSKYQKVSRMIEKNRLNTVCLEADCPNRYECFSAGTATFMILGSVCTRNCRYCNIKKGRPEPIDKEEPFRIARAVKQLKLAYAVITGVTRDDLPDQGAGQFAKTTFEIKKTNPRCKIELLISDLRGDWPALKKIIRAEPNVINHNLETVKDLFPKLRPKGSYSRSLKLLKKSKEIKPRQKTKSGLMVGLGEKNSQIVAALKDLKRAGCDLVVVGQYLKPFRGSAPVKKYYRPEEFKKIEAAGQALGLNKIIAGPLVRSSYHAYDPS